MAFPGTFLAVSHDRYFLDKVANCTLELENGHLTEYGGSYSYYRRKKEEDREPEKEADSRRHETRAVKREESPEPVREKKPQRSQFQGMSEAKLEELIQRAEAEIAMAEAELKGLEYEMNQPEVQSDPERSRAIAEAYAAKEQEIEERYGTWEKLTES